MDKCKPLLRGLVQLGLARGAGDEPLPRPSGEAVMGDAGAMHAKLGGRDFYCVAPVTSTRDPVGPPLEGTRITVQIISPGAGPSTDDDDNESGDANGPETLFELSIRQGQILHGEKLRFDSIPYQNRH